MYGMAIIWAGIMLLFTKNRSFIIKIIVFAGIIIAGFLIIYTGSRKGLIGLGFFSIALAWISIKKFGYTLFRKFALILLSLGVIYGVFMIIYTSPFFGRIETMFQGETSFDTRVYLLKEALNVWKSSFKNTTIGIGIDNFRFHNNMMTYSHSTVSEILVSTGIIGFVLYFTAIISIFVAYLKAYKITFPDNKTIILVIIAFLVLTLFFNATAVMFDDRLFLPLIGIISSYGVIINETSSIDNSYPDM